jgi:hypothetical protein
VQGVAGGPEAAERSDYMRRTSVFSAEGARRSGKLGATGWVVIIFAAAALLVLVGVWLNAWWHKRARQAVPSIAGGLQGNKSEAEGHVARVKGLRLDANTLDKGKKLYITAKSKQDACITSLKTAAKQFTPADAANGRAQLKEAVDSTNAFVEWAKAQEPNAPIGATVTVPTPLDLADWIENQDDKEVKALQDALEAIRFRDWDEISADKPNPAGHLPE